SISSKRSCAGAGSTARRAASTSTSGEGASRRQRTSTSVRVRSGRRALTSLSATRIRPVITVPAVRRPNSPAPNSRPMAEVIHSEAAVVRPWMEKPVRKITPAHRKPIPVSTPWAMRVGSVTMFSSGRARKAQSAWVMAASISRQDARLTRMWVRNPAGRPRHSRSQPIIPPAISAPAMGRTIVSSQAASTMLFDVGFGVLVDRLDPGDVTRLEGGVAHAELMTRLQVGVDAEIRQPLTLFLAHVLGVDDVGLAHRLEPGLAADLVLGHGL